MAKNWIETLHKGAFHKHAAEHGGLDEQGNIKQSFIDSCMNSSNPHVRRMAATAKTLGKLRPTKGGSK